VQHLLYVGDHGIGALEFHPPEELPGRAAEQEALEVAQLVADARRIVGGEAEVAIPEIYRIGTSAGGVRPKAVVRYNPRSGEVRSAFASPQPGDVPAILKFDGVGGPAAAGELGAPEPFNRVEAAYARMARDAGLDVVDVVMLESGLGHAHLVVPRFDDPDGRRLHQHTLGGLLDVDYNEPGASSYEELLRAMLKLDMPPAAVIGGDVRDPGPRRSHRPNCRGAVALAGVRAGARGAGRGRSAHRGGAGGAGAGAGGMTGRTRTSSAKRLHAL
jgi:serine/threonine-protein kinase HipA